MHKTYSAFVKSLSNRPARQGFWVRHFRPNQRQPGAVSRPLRSVFRPRFSCRWLLILSFLLVIGMISFPWLWRAWVNFRYAPAIYTAQEFLQQPSVLDDGTPAPSAASDAEDDELRVAIVFGARVYGSGRLSAMLRDRVDTAVDLYQAGKVDKLLLSGGQATGGYDEPGAMMAHARARGVPAADMQPDFGGRRTYDTCYRAAHIFQVEEAVLVTQAFHLPRALFLCNNLDIRVAGVEADRRVYDPRSIAWSETRELPALVFALIDLVRAAPPPILGEPIPLD